MEITNLKTMLIVANYLNRSNISCTVFSTRYYEVTWVKPQSGNIQHLWMHNQYGEFESHMSTSSKGLNERCRLRAYVSTTVYDRSWKGTTEQFVLHFHEQFRQLDEAAPQNEHLPHSVRLTLLQTAVRSDPELRIVETMEEYVSLTNSSSRQVSITYDKYSSCCKMLGVVSDMIKI